MSAHDSTGTVTHVFHHPDAGAVADRLRGRFKVVECERPPQDATVGFHLWAVDDHLELRGGPGGGSVWLRLSELKRRAAQGSELLRACGAADRPSVLDAMAGWGVDALTLAARGCRVTMIERHPAVAAMQQDLVRRAGFGGGECRCGDGYVELGSATWDVVYLDPMFPTRNKVALPGKRMQWLAALAEPDPRPLDRWLDAARASARARVVLKRRRKDAVIGRPQWQIQGRSVRYDVYRGSAGQVSCSTA